MAKVQKLSGITPVLPFSEYDLFSSYRQSFDKSDLGALHRLFPFSEFSSGMKLSKKPTGRIPYFDGQGKIALMILKHLSGFSDKDLITHLNSNLHYQFFCGIYIHPASPLTNFKIVSDIRCELARCLDINTLQRIIADKWKPYLDNLHLLFSDATCYESHVRYPTDVKLLWECVEWLYKQMRLMHKHLRVRMPRTKYDKQSSRYHSYSKKRKRRKSETRVLKRSLLHLQSKLIGLIDEFVEEYRDKLTMNKSFRERMSVIRTIYRQQQLRFDGGKVDNQIVSIHKSYIRPIVRGKETKSVEFGAKVNLLQVDGINFIEHLSFDAFHEGIRLPSCILKQQELFHTEVTHVGADALYATNANRKYCSQNNITTSFVRKGRAGRDEDQTRIVRGALSKERSTRLEGSFGVEKEHYTLRKVKAMTEQTEILWIFFGIHTANAVRMIEKVRKKHLKEKEKIPA